MPIAPSTPLRVSASWTLFDEVLQMRLDHWSWQEILFRLWGACFSLRCAFSPQLVVLCELRPSVDSVVAAEAGVAHHHSHLATDNKATSSALRQLFGTHGDACSKQGVCESSKFGADEVTPSSKSPPAPQHHLRLRLRLLGRLLLLLLLFLLFLLFVLFLLFLLFFLLLLRLLLLLSFASSSFTTTSSSSASLLLLCSLLVLPPLPSFPLLSSGCSCVGTCECAAELTVCDARPSRTAGHVVHCRVGDAAHGRIMAWTVYMAKLKVSRALPPHAASSIHVWTFSLCPVVPLHSPCPLWHLARMVGYACTVQSLAVIHFQSITGLS